MNDIFDTLSHTSTSTSPPRDISIFLDPLPSDVSSLITSYFHGEPTWNERLLELVSQLHHAVDSITTPSIYNLNGALYLPFLSILESAPPKSEAWQYHAVISAGISCLVHIYTRQPNAFASYHPLIGHTFAELLLAFRTDHPTHIPSLLLYENALQPLARDKSSHWFVIHNYLLRELNWRPIILPGSCEAVGRVGVPWERVRYLGRSWAVVREVEEGTTHIWSFESVEERVRRGELDLGGGEVGEGQGHGMIWAT